MRPGAAATGWIALAMLARVLPALFPGQTLPLADALPLQPLGVISPGPDSVFNDPIVVLMAAVDADNRTRSLEAQYRVGNGPFQPAGIFTKPSRVPFENLTPGTTYDLQVRCVGGTTGYSDWSDPVSHMAT